LQLYLIIQITMTLHQHVWALSRDQVYASLETSAQGLSETEANKRLDYYGANELPAPKRRSLVLRFVDQLTHFMALLLWIAGILAFISNTPVLAWAIWAAIWISAIFSFWQEFQAERALTALKQVLPMQVKVYRDGMLKVIPARELVRGDLVQLEEGDRISADARLVDAQSLYVDVSVLTGESLPVSRHADRIPIDHVRPAEVANLIFAGSTVAAGRGLAVVYATGTQTEFGHVAKLTATVQRSPSTMEAQVQRIVHVISTLAIGMGVTVFLLSYFLIGMGIGESFIFGIGIIVANVPEGLLPTVTLALAIGVKKMARRNALVRRLSAVETLSAATVVCTDKTGTLTKNEMTVRTLWMPTAEVEVSGVGYVPEGEIRLHAHKDSQVSEAVNWKHLRLLLAGGALCSNAHLRQPPGSSRWEEIGDPTEAALIVAALKAKLDLEQIRQHSNRVREIPFDSRRKMMTVVLDWHSYHLWQKQATYLSFTKGATDEVLKRCGWLRQNDHTEAMSEAERAHIARMDDRLASMGYRVLAVAARWGDDELLNLEPQLLEQNMIFLGLVASIDPPRPEVAGAIAQCRQAQIKTTMITGDHGLTAEAIGRRIGLVEGKTTIISGDEMKRFSDAQLRQILQRRSGLIFARTQPEQKLRIVQAYKDLGHIVAVTGDGVNDAPALRAANIGIAMGISGTDVARESADIVLIDDNFATIISAIEQGRAIYQNIRKFMTYILVSNVPEIMPFLAMVLFKIPPSLTVLQILIVDLGTDIVPALALGAEPPEAGIMQQPPRPKEKKLLDRNLLLQTYGFMGLIEAALGFVGFFAVWRGYGYGFAEVQQFTAAILDNTAPDAIMHIYHQSTTVSLAAIVACQIGNLFACRSNRVSIFQLGFFSNSLVWLGIASETILMLAIAYIPFCQKIFATAALSAQQLLALLICPLIILSVEELRKVVIDRFFNSTAPHLEAKH
jgi:potassium/sodium efflux P-type ATPase